MVKKADLSLNMIVVAVLLIIVLVVMVAIFTGKMNLFQKGLKSCASQGGKCSCFNGANPVNADGSINWITGSCTDGKNQGCPDGWGGVEGTDCNSDKKDGNDLCCIKVI